MTDAEPTPPPLADDADQTDDDSIDGPEGIRDRSVREVVERTRDVIRKTRELLDNSRELLDRVRHRDGGGDDADAEDSTPAPDAPSGERSA